MSPLDITPINMILHIYIPMDVNSLISYFESLGFFVSDGLKYGVDLLLYTDHPSKVHSKYAVLLERNHKMFDIVGIQRVCGSVNKELIFVKNENGRPKFYKIQRFEANSNVYSTL